MGLAIPSGLSESSGLTITQGVSIGDGLSFQQFGPASGNAITLEIKTDFLVQEDNTSLLLQEQ